MVASRYWLWLLAFVVLIGIGACGGGGGGGGGSPTGGSSTGGSSTGGSSTGGADDGGESPFLEFGVGAPGLGGGGGASSALPAPNAPQPNAPQDDTSSALVFRERDDFSSQEYYAPPGETQKAGSGHLGGFYDFVTGASDTVIFYPIDAGDERRFAFKEQYIPSDESKTGVVFETAGGADSLIVTVMPSLVDSEGRFTYADPGRLPLKEGYVPVGFSGMIGFLTVTGAQGPDTTESSYVVFGSTIEDYAGSSSASLPREGARGVDGTSTLDYHGHAIASTPDFGQTYRGKATVALEIAGDTHARAGEASVTSLLDFRRNGGGYFTLRSDTFASDKYTDKVSGRGFRSGEVNWPGLGSVETYDAFVGLYGLRVSDAFVRAIEQDIQDRIDDIKDLDAEELSTWGFGSAAARDVFVSAYESYRDAQIYNLEALVNPLLQDVPEGLSIVPDNVAGSFGLYGGDDNPVLFGGYASWPVRK